MRNYFKQQDEGVTGTNCSFCGRVWQSDFWGVSSQILCLQVAYLLLYAFKLLVKK